MLHTSSRYTESENQVIRMVNNTRYRHAAPVHEDQLRTLMDAAGLTECERTVIEKRSFGRLDVQQCADEMYYTVSAIGRLQRSAIVKMGVALERMCGERGTT